MSDNSPKPSEEERSTKNHSLANNDDSCRDLPTYSDFEEDGKPQETADALSQRSVERGLAKSGLTKNARAAKIKKIRRKTVELCSEPRFCVIIFFVVTAIVILFACPKRAGKDGPLYFRPYFSDKSLLANRDEWDRYGNYVKSMEPKYAALQEQFRTENPDSYGAKMDLNTFTRLQLGVSGSELYSIPNSILVKGRVDYGVCSLIIFLIAGLIYILNYVSVATMNKSESKEKTQDD